MCYNVFKLCVMLSSIVCNTFKSRPVTSNRFRGCVKNLSLKAAVSDNMVILPILFIHKLVLQTLHVKAFIHISLTNDVFLWYISALL